MEYNENHTKLRRYIELLSVCESGKETNKAVVDIYQYCSSFYFLRSFT